VTTPLPAAPPIAPVGGDTRIVPFTGAAPSGRGNTAAYKSEPKALKLPYSEQALAQLSRTETPAARNDAPPRAEPRAEPKADTGNDAARGPEDIEWAWPVKGKVIGTFSEGSNKGIAIAGRMGQPVVASAPGRVIFSGTGIRGFGKLIVIKHNNTYLSVYAHNSELSVKEGQSVARGQKIAEMGNTDADQVKLHFEIRRFGKPVDPMKLLPAG
jgi:lipoprotein NlpD